MLISRDLFKCLCANKISLNVTKTEVIIFHDPHKILDFNIRLKLNGEPLTLSNSVRYLGISLDPFLPCGSLLTNFSPLNFVK